MRIIINIATFCAASIFFCNCSMPPDTNSPILKPINLNTVIFMQNAIKKIGSQFPELAQIGTTETTTPAQIPGYVSAGFFLRKNPRYLRKESSHAPGTPICDINVNIVCFASSVEVQKYIKKSLFGIERPARPAPKEKYKGAILYRYGSGFGHVVCQDGLYVIEITPINEGAGPWAMKVLDVVLTELGSTSSKSK